MNLDRGRQLVEIHPDGDDLTRLFLSARAAGEDSGSGIAITSWTVP